MQSTCQGKPILFGQPQRSAEFHLPLSRCSFRQRQNCVYVFKDQKIDSWILFGWLVLPQKRGIYIFKGGSASVPSVPKFQGTYIRLLIDIYNAPSVGSACPRTDGSGGNEWGGGYVKNAHLLLTMPIPWSKTVVRVGECALDVYISSKKNSKGIGLIWKVGDTILCQNTRGACQKCEFITYHANPPVRNRN